MAVKRGNQLRLIKEETGSGLRPSAGYLFRSVVETFSRNAIGVLLTGMGSDGAVGLKAMADAGAATIGQDQESCVVYGMPAVAARLGACQQILPLDAIPAALLHAAADRAGAAAS